MPYPHTLAVTDEQGVVHPASADKIVIAKLNVDENPTTSTNARIGSIPTLNVYRKGELVKQIIGAKPKAALLADLAEFL